MNKRLLPMLSLCFAALSVQAQSPTLNEGFEGSDVPPEGWTMRTSSDDASNKFKWEQTAYTSDPLKYRSGYDQGGTYAMMSSSGKVTSAGVKTDSYLISPAVSVAEGDVLSFMLAYAPVYNDALAETNASSRSKFAVLVSTTGTDAADFTDTLYVFTPFGETNWRKKAYSLEQYAGKTIYLAFWDYCDGTVGSAFLLNRTWIDDVKVGQGTESDLVVTELLSPVAGPETSQPVSFRFTNSAMANTGFTASYSLNGGEPVSETSSEMICATGDTLTYTFQTPATLVPGQDNELKLWVTADNDAVHSNDTLSTKVQIDNVFDLPYEMNSDNCAQGWNYTYHKKVGKNYTGWWNQPDASGEKLVWTYKMCSKESVLEGKWFNMEEGKNNLVFNYTSGTDVPLTLEFVDYATDEVTSTDVTLPASTDAVDEKVSVKLPADGKYKLRIKPATTYVGPFVINTLAISKAVPSDVQVSSVDLLSALPAGDRYTLIVDVKNNGEQDVTDVPVKVSLDGEVVDEDVVPVVPAGSTVSWPIDSDDATKAHGLCLTVGDHVVKVFTDLEDDADMSNDTLTTNVYGYDRPTLPYTCSFEDENDPKVWLTANMSDNALNWTIGSAMVGNVNWAIDGENAAYMSSVAGAEHNAALISPEIQVAEAGKVSLSYYYTTRMLATEPTDVTSLTAYVSDLSTGDVVAQCTNEITDENQGNYRQGYMLVDLPAAGNYQIAFLNTGTGHDVVLDKVFFGACTDVAVVAAEQTAKSGFNNTVNKVTVTLTNHGSQAVDNVKLTLSTTADDAEPVETVAEYAQTIEPGDTVSYTFDDVDVSAPAAYACSVSVSAAEDNDASNDKLTLPVFHTYANATVPYTEDFDSEDHQAQWTLGGTWQTGVYSSSSAAYNGTGAISHHKKAENEDGDWAFSGCIEIPAGTYDLSFFYRTYLNGKTASLYPQNFAFYLGTEPSAEAMTQTLYTSPTDVLAYEKRYKRVEQQFTVPEDGKYYIGVKCTSTSPYGVLYLDNIEVYDAAKTAPVLTEYETDFSDFYFYDPSTQFVQWEKEASDDAALTATQTIYNAGNPSKDLPGVIVSPAFTIPEGMTLTATLEYSMKAEDATNLTEDALAQMKTLLYIADADTLGTNSTLLATGTNVSGEKATAEATLACEAAAPHYFIVKVEGPTNCVSDNASLTYNLYGLKLTTVATGIATVRDLGGKVQLYTANGILVGEYDNAAQALQHAVHGVNILKATDGGATMKIVK